jgi:hypothetical protein
MAKAVGFSDEGGRRIVRAVKRVERGGDGGGGGDWYPFRGDDPQIVLGKTSAAWAKNSAADIPVYAGPAGSETDAGYTVTAMNKFAAIAAGKFVILAGPNQSGVWYLISAECS